MLYFLVYFGNINLHFFREAIFAKIFLGIAVNKPSVYGYLIEQEPFIAFFAISHIILPVGEAVEAYYLNFIPLYQRLSLL